MVNKSNGPTVPGNVSAEKPKPRRPANTTDTRSPLIGKFNMGNLGSMFPKLSEGNATGNTSSLTGLFGNPKRFAESIINMAPGKFAEMMRKMGGGN